MKPYTMLLLAFAAAAAQTPAAAAPAIGQQMKQNEEALRQYSFKRRTQIEIKGKSWTRTELVRTINGQKETIPLDAPRQAEQGQAGQFGAGWRGHLLRGMVMKQKKEEMKQDIENLQGLLQKYLPLGSEPMRAALKKAGISRTGEGPEGGIKVVANGVVEPKDSLTLYWNVTGRRPERIEVHSQLAGKPATADVNFASLPDGPFYAARTVVSEPKKNITITIDTFDYTRASDSQ